MNTISSLLKFIGEQLSPLKNWISKDANSQIVSTAGWLPSGVNYGTVLRLRGDSSPGVSGSDTYYICIDVAGTFYVGRQINGATAITWRAI